MMVSSFMAPNQPWLSHPKRRIFLGQIVLICEMGEIAHDRCTQLDATKTCRATRQRTLLRSFKPSGPGSRQVGRVLFAPARYRDKGTGRRPGRALVHPGR